MTKIIFLDVDGPLIPGKSRLLPGNGIGYWGWTFDRNAVSMLNFLSWAVPNLRVVLSSHRWMLCESPLNSHPTTGTREFWEEIFEKNELEVKFHDDWITPRTGWGSASDPKFVEITRWKELHPELTHFATLEDDLNRGDSVSAKMVKAFHLVAENYDEGLTHQDFITLCAYFEIRGSKLMELMAEYSEKMLQKVAVTEFITW